MTVATDHLELFKSVGFDQITDSLRQLISSGGGGSEGYEIGDVSRTQEELTISDGDADVTLIVSSEGTDTFTNEDYADYLAQGVRFALASGNHEQARAIALQGTHSYPDHAQLSLMSRVLGPPESAEFKPSSAAVKENMEWIRAHSNEFKGQWVAIRNGQLLTAGGTAREVWEALDDSDEVLLTRVL